ncbi:hypothetical protein NX059_001425 [Plenodomus lindquistii]|nr:hypothetical protein NX059_001425 [Plenodomus lindquistii]
MADWDDFQRKARAVIPAQELKPKRCWIGVLSHEKKPTDTLSEVDFVWMLGHSKITTQKIHETYKKTFNVEGLELKHKGAVVGLSDIVRSFQTPGDSLVLFLASRPETVRTPNPSITGPSLICSDSALQADIARQSHDSPSTRLATRTKSIPPLDGTSELVGTSSPTLAHPRVPAGNAFGFPSTIESQRSSPTPIRPEDPARHGFGLPSTVGSRRTSALSNTALPYQVPYHASQGLYIPEAHYPRNPLSSTPVSGVFAAPRTRAENVSNAPLIPTGPPPNSYRGPYLGGINQSPTYTAPFWNHASAVSTASSGPLGMAGINAQEVSAVHAALMQDETAVKSEAGRSLSRASSFGFQDAKDDSMPSFDPDEVFTRQMSPDSQEEVTTLSQQHIRAIIDRQDPLILEAGVQKAIANLQTLKARFAQHATTNAESESWVQSIDRLIPQAERKRTVVGVVGNTGAGKSSVINALLDEERLVPTNCMRACTAVVTEISWNASTSSSDKYRAEIDFISHADWEKELHILLKEFLTENGTLSRDVSDPNSDAGIAWAKFHSVYPDIPRDTLGECTVPRLMARPAIAEILGATKKIACAMPGRFYNDLQSYVDSKEKVTKKSKDKSKEKSTGTQMEYWPLIKVVKIYTKSPALSTGACIVDLPGVHDSNAARAAVAQGYLKQCTGLWIVAPINRAVDDKAAKTLLGDTFKRQLKYDGGFSTVTFICSKTDDISITEAIDSLELEEEIADLEQEQAQHDKQIKQVERTIANLKDEQDDFKVALNNASDEIEQWETLQEMLDDGKTVFAPLPASKKRKKSSSGKQSRKKSGRDDDTDDDFLATDDEETEDEEEPIDDSQRMPLSEADIKQKLKELRDVKKDARRAAIAKKHEMEEQKSQIQELNAKIKEIKAKISRICIAGRNEYSKTAIQADFAAGIKEIDQENAAEEDEDNFNPDEETRDYDQVAKSLPVFCVSSRAYQKMQGRLIKDDDVPGFVTPEETEVPQLQAHCKKLTEGGRIQTARTFLLNFCQLMTTFHLWASDDGTGLKMTDEDKAKQVSYLKRRLGQLETGLEQAVQACIGEMRSELKNQIFDKTPELINEAIEAAPTTALAWGQKDMGGLHWGTYKAVVRRDGVYHSPSAGLRDFNADLVDPILKKLASGWERAFQSRLPQAFKTYVTNSSKVLHAFHSAVEERARKNGVGLASLTMLKTQINTYEQLYADLGTLLVTQMTELQREANRDFTPTIANIMHTVYYACAVESGPGSYKRMKEHMMNHIEQQRHQMFHNATKTVEKHLDQMCKALQESMEAKADEIFVQMNRDYMQALAGREIKAPMLLKGREEREIRKEIKELILGLDEQFEDIASGNLDVSVGHVKGETPSVGDDEDNGVFEDTQESTSDQDENEDSVMAGIDDTTITEPTPSKPVVSSVSSHSEYQPANFGTKPEDDF